MGQNHRKDNEEPCDDNVMEVKKAMLLNAMADPGGIDTRLTASDQPIGPGAEELNKKKRP